MPDEGSVKMASPLEKTKAIENFESRYNFVVKEQKR
jgi:hypothetical protein